MAFGVPFAFVIESLFDDADVSAPYGCRSTASAGGRSACGPTPRRHPYCHRPTRCSPARADEELRSVDDSYVLFIDLPGFRREQVTVKVDDGFLFVTAADKSPTQEASSVKAHLMERRRGGFNQRWKLPEDALLDGIHAKLQNGELVVVIPKRTEQVLKHFIIPILGADEPSSTAQLDNASIPAQLPQGPGDKPMTAEPEAAAPTEPAANAPVTAEVEHAAHAEPAADAPATADAAAAHAAVEAPAAPAVADVPAATAPVQASAPLAAVVAAADAAMPDAKEGDGSWEDVSDEEREALQAFIRAKGKAPMEGPVLEEIERQEAERIARMQHDADSD